jgi:hypothetical protein
VKWKKVLFSRMSVPAIFTLQYVLHSSVRFIGLVKVSKT